MHETVLEHVCVIKYIVHKENQLVWCRMVQLATHTQNPVRVHTYFTYGWLRVNGETTCVLLKTNNIQKACMRVVCPAG
jgi:hypothetical protein